MDMLPWNLTCPCLFSEGGREGFEEGGIQARLAREKPPTSPSDINLQARVDSGSWNEASM